jgi:hypothetical protein
MQGSTLKALEDLVWRFDFDTLTREKDYADVYNPEELIIIIDGLLLDEGKLLGGVVTSLVEMKHYLKNTVTVIFSDGEQASRQRWKSASEEKKFEYQELEPKEFQKIANSLVPKELRPNEQSWFVEGFCRQWQKEWLEFFKEIRS